MVFGDVVKPIFDFKRFKLNRLLNFKFYNVCFLIKLNSEHLSHQTRKSHVYYSPHSYTILQTRFLCIISKLSWKLRTIHLEKLNALKNPKLRSGDILQIAPSEARTFASRIKTSFGGFEGITNMHILHVVLCFIPHYCDAIMATMASQITRLAIVY